MGVLINNKRAIFGVFIGMFVLFTLASAPSVDGIIYDYVCSNNDLLKTWQSNITTDDGIETVALERDPIPCPYGCTNLTYPAQCIVSPRTDAYTMPYVSTPIFLLFEIIALAMLGLGVFYRTETDEMVIILPILATVIFITLSVSALNIDGIANPLVMWFNFGFFMLSLIASVSGYIKKPLEDMGTEEV